MTCLTPLPSWHVLAGSAVVAAERAGADLAANAVPGATAPARASELTTAALAAATALAETALANTPLANTPLANTRRPLCCSLCIRSSLVCRNPAVPERPAGHVKSQNQTQSDRYVTSEPILATLPPAILSFHITAGNPDVAVTASVRCCACRSAARRGGYDPPVAVDAVIFDWGGTLTPWHTIDGAEMWRI